MATLRFDLNDITREPSDEELESLMEAVIEEVRRRSKIIEAQLKENLRQAIQEVLQKGNAP